MVRMRSSPRNVKEVLRVKVGNSMVALRYNSSFSSEKIYESLRLCQPSYAQPQMKS